MKNMWLKCLIINLYLIQLSLGLVTVSMGTFAIVYCVLVITSIVLVLINVFYAITRSNSCISETNYLMRMIKRAKLAVIPFYIINFMFWAVGAFVFAMARVVILDMFIIPIAALYAYIILLGTSCYSVRVLFYYKKHNIITKKILIVHILLQLIFVLDVFSIFYLSRHEKKIIIPIKV